MVMIAIPSSHKVWLLTPRDADEIWPMVCYFIADACKESGGRHSPDGVRKAIQQGQFDLFVAVENGEVLSACVTTISDYTAAKWLTIILCGGKDMLQWIDEGKTVLDHYAAANDCVGIEVFGRTGWVKAMDLGRVGAWMERRL